MTDFESARRAMVDCQVRPSDVTRYAIIDAMLAVPRERFVPKALRDVAYADAEVPLGDGRALLAPRTIAKMLEAASVGSEDLVLDLAPGLGYSSALLGRLAAAVVAVEPDAAMAAHAAETAAALEIDNVIVTHGEPADGDPAHGPFDVIFINGAVERIPETLADQLKAGGRLVAIHADRATGQCRVSVRAGETLSHRAVFDAGAPLLAGFEVPRAFVF